MRTSLLLFLITVFALTCSSHAQTTSAQPAAQQGYLIGPGDVISIKALGEPSFDVEALTVDEDGKILIPYVETPLIAKCKTERGLQADVVKAWSKYLRRPQVYLRVAQRNSRPPVHIYGAVMEQQKVDLTRRAYLLEMVAFAGVDTTKSSGSIQVFRPRPPMCGDAEHSNWAVNAGTGEGLNVPSKIFSYKELNAGTEGSNPEILPGDIILVQKAAQVYVTGEVLKPGEVNIPEGGLPLTQAIAAAAGTSRDAKKNISIFRKRSDSPQPEVMAINYGGILKGEEKDVMLQPYDIVLVGKAKKSIGDILLEAVTGIPNRVPIPLRPF